MPYRRLPNTDLARIRALRQAIDGFHKQKKGNEVLAPSTVYNLELKLKELISSVDNYNQAFESQKNNQKLLKEQFQICKMYISHFIQVMNFCIMRDELPMNIRKYYLLSQKDFNLPTLQTELQVFEWGKTIIAGEIQRVKEGGKPIENPSIGKVKTAYDNFSDSYLLQKSLQKRTKNTLHKLSQIRPEIDELIKKVWDEIENYFVHYPSIIKREKAQAFGIKYIYRKNEERMELDDILNY